MWLIDYDKAKEESLRTKKPILLQFEMETCGGCKKLYEYTYQDPKAAGDLSEHFVLLRLDIMKDREQRRLYGAYWTPSFYFLDHNGKSYHSFNGYLPPNDFRVLLRLGYAQASVPKGKYRETLEFIEKDFDDFRSTDLAPKLLVQKGMILLLQSKDNTEFKKLMKKIIEEYPDSPEARMYFWDE